ncbi:PepSY domain-containing protein [Sinobaca sp. H24]|uniref:PepSY domain-containing protein n=1 Tax=Sinobaca sp. H24 TaxID=2923376 RepID=UPI00207A3DB8|nr:PepSY domain-containing protein [Sinobaca sp. H24]
MKKLIIITLCVIAIGAVAVGVQMFSASADDPSINSEEAKELAASRYPGDVTVLELNNESGEQIYTLEIDGDDRDYRLKLNADSGEVVQLSEITDTGSEEPESNDNGTTETTAPNRKPKKKRLTPLLPMRNRTLPAKQDLRRISFL